MHYSQDIISNPTATIYTKAQRRNPLPNKSTTPRRLAALGYSLLVALFATSNTQAEEEKRCVMFERADVVNLDSTAVPTAFQRTEITDAQGRKIQGQWVAIDRKSKMVKFRRTDGKEFDIPMASLSAIDRRYAELETGYVWQIDPMPTAVDIVKEDILAFDSMDDTHVHLRCVYPKDPSVPYVPEFQINLLTDKDRALIKQKTGRELPVLPRPQPDRASRAWNYPRPLFGHEVPKFTPAYFPATLKLMRATYTPQEMLDAVRVRTWNTSFIHEYFRQKYDEAEDNQKSGTKSLADILEIISSAPSPANETKSIKPLIAKLKLVPYSEKVPRDPAEPLRFIRDGRSVLSQPGAPIDGELQAFFFMSQYLRLTANKPAVPLGTLLENTPYRFTGVGQIIEGKQTDVPPEQRRKFYTRENILPGIEKTFGYKGWKVFVPLVKSYLKPDDAEQALLGQLTAELIRQQIRNGCPVYARKIAKDQSPEVNGTQLIITGFTAQMGKPLMYEAISIKGSIWGNDPYTGEYEVTETSLPESGVMPSSVTFLEKP